MIWCDLDNTLIWTWMPVTTPLASIVLGQPMGAKPPRGRGLRRSRQMVIAGEKYFACSRKNADRFLAALRELGEVRMLTSAIKAYALRMNREFRFDFAPSQIVAREDMKAAAGGVDPKGVLIDNVAQYPGFDDLDTGRRLKLRYLGLGAITVEVPYFFGNVNDPFGYEWREYVAETKRHVLRPDPSPPPSDSARIDPTPAT